MGVKPKHIDTNIKYESGTIHLDNEELDVKYVITQDLCKTKINSDIIFYFHGLGRTELDWVDAESFGPQYYRLLKNNPQLKPLPVVSISFGLIYIIYKDVPYPYNTNLEKAFVDKVMPYFKKKLGCNGKVYLIGHSMGGFNVLTLSLRNPEMFPVVLAVSPFILPYSPFDNNFSINLQKLGMDITNITNFQNWIKIVYKTEKNWILYNPYNLLDKQGAKPYIFLSSASNDYAGFDNTILLFEEKLKTNNITHIYCKSNGPHKSTDDTLFYKFLCKVTETSTQSNYVASNIN